MVPLPLKCILGEDFSCPVNMFTLTDFFKLIFLVSRKIFLIVREINFFLALKIVFLADENIFFL